MLAFCREKLLQRPTCPEACRHSRQLVNRHSPQRQLRSKRSLQTRSDSSRQSVIERAVNSVTEVITKSPLNEGKKRFFQRLAGDYDPAAIQAKIDNLTKQHPASPCVGLACKSAAELPEANQARSPYLLNLASRLVCWFPSRA